MPSILCKNWSVWNLTGRVSSRRWFRAHECRHCKIKANVQLSGRRELGHVLRAHKPPRYATLHWINSNWIILSLISLLLSLGQTFDIRSNGECVNMPGTFNDKASSIDTYNTCMRVFEHGNCQGRSFEYRPGNGYHFNMGQDGFNDVVSSVIAC